MLGKKWIAALIMLALSSSLLAAEQQVFRDYFAALPLFWQQVYPDGGNTLYCGQHFAQDQRRDINVEHVYPMAWVMSSLGCRSRDACRRKSPRFNQIESDMHNLFPAREDINRIRGSAPFDIIPGEARRFGHCDFEFDTRKRRAEPAPAARGEIARAMFHMQESYGLKIFRRQGEMLQRWNREDPPDQEEQRRNTVIEKLQGTRNRFIDDPEAAAKLRF
ncbi:MAG: endonuclease [Chromatiaceae bacterium]|nr:endonuclease [Chromatiaceae bacterium]